MFFIQGDHSVLDISKFFRESNPVIEMSKDDIVNISRNAKEKQVEALSSSLLYGNK